MRAMVRWFVPVWAGMGLVFACTPVTLSHKGVLDFTRYRTVYVAPLEGDGSPNDREYLIRELRDNAGFTEVVIEETTGSETVLTIDVTADRGTSAVVLHWQLTERSSKSTIDSGEVTESAEDYFAAVEACMDEVVRHYLAPYRI